MEIKGEYLQYQAGRCSAFRTAGITIWTWNSVDPAQEEFVSRGKKQTDTYLHPSCHKLKPFLYLEIFPLAFITSLQQHVTQMRVAEHSLTSLEQVYKN